MKAKLVARGFINSVAVRDNGNIFFSIALMIGSNYLDYSVVVDKSYAKYVSDILEFGGVDSYMDAVKGKPIVFCVANPVAKIASGEIKYTGVLLKFTFESTYESDKGDFLNGI